MITNKTVCKIKQSLTFLLWKFIEAVLVIFVAIVFVFFVDTLLITIITLSHSVTEVSVIVFKYFTLLTNTCARILNIIFFTFMIIFTFTLTCFIIHFLIWFTCCTTEFAFKITWNMFCHCFSFICFLLSHFFVNIYECLKCQIYL